MMPRGTVSLLFGPWITTCNTRRHVAVPPSADLRRASVCTCRKALAATNTSTSVPRNQTRSAPTVRGSRPWRHNPAVTLGGGARPRPLDATGELRGVSREPDGWRWPLVFIEAAELVGAEGSDAVLCQTGGVPDICGPGAVGGPHPHPDLRWHPSVAYERLAQGSAGGWVNHVAMGRHARIVSLRSDKGWDTSRQFRA